eukprot:m.1125425 g.1125425  ORF g.1125425 m.1125425 type:complete len:220 (-) comp24408_c0_seq60:1478-2137(-)
MQKVLLLHRGPKKCLNNRLPQQFNFEIGILCSLAFLVSTQHMKLRIRESTVGIQTDVLHRRWRSSRMVKYTATVAIVRTLSASSHGTCANVFVTIPGGNAKQYLQVHPSVSYLCVCVSVFCVCIRVSQTCLTDDCQNMVAWSQVSHLTILCTVGGGDFDAVMCTHDDGWNNKNKKEHEERLERFHDLGISFHLLHSQLPMDVPCIRQHIPARCNTNKHG